MIKGVIADVKKNKAVLICENGEFITIRNDNYTIGQKITYRKPSITKYASLVACLVLILILGSVGTKLYYTSTSYIDIDINPSFRLEMNLFDVVIRIKPLNDDADELLRSKRIPGNISECINTVVDISEKHGYINENNSDLEIVVVSEKEDLIETVNDAIGILKEKNLTVNIHQASYEDLKLAEEYNISVGRLLIIENYTKLYGGKIEDNISGLALVSNDEIKSIKGIKDKTKSEVIGTNPEVVLITETPAPVDSSVSVNDNAQSPDISEVSGTKHTEIPATNHEIITPAPTGVSENNSMTEPEKTDKPVNTVKSVETEKPVETEKVEKTECSDIKSTATPEPTKEATNVPTVEPTSVPTRTPKPRPTETHSDKPSKHNKKNHEDFSIGGADFRRFR